MRRLGFRRTASAAAKGGREGVDRLVALALLPRSRGRLGVIEAQSLYGVRVLSGAVREDRAANVDQQVFLNGFFAADLNLAVGSLYAVDPGAVWPRISPRAAPWTRAPGSICGGNRRWPWTGGPQENPWGSGPPTPSICWR